MLLPRFVTAFVLLFINAVHFMVATYFQIPGNYYDKLYSESVFTRQVIYFGTALVFTLLYPIIVRKISLKYTLLSAIACDLIGLGFLWLSLLFEPNFSIAIIGTFFSGASFLTVCISIITYLVLTFPKRLGAALLALFAFGDVGEILANLLFSAFDSTNYDIRFFLLTLPLLSLVIWLIASTFSAPEFPSHLERLRKGSLIWKEFHYRLGFFLLAAIGYGIVESVFAVWGEVYLMNQMPQKYATATISLYWLTMMMGKFILVLPLYFFRASKVFPFLIISTMLAIIYIEYQTTQSGFLLGFGLAGLSLAAVMPLLITSLEAELISSSTLSHRRNYLPYVEIGTALIVGAHFLGVGLMTFYVSLAYDLTSVFFFHWAIAITALIGIISGFLSYTFQPHKKY